MGRILAIDYGDKRMGVALSDPMKITAQPFEVIEVVSFKKAANRIVEIAREKDVELIILGMPYTSTGEEGETAKKVRDFASLLEKRTNIPIKFVDERMTTMGVTRVLKEAGVKREKRKKVVDKLAATYLLEGYLESLR